MADWLKQAHLLTTLADKAFVAGDHVMAIVSLRRASECLEIARNLKEPEDEIEVTAEMIEAGAEYFYGAEPFWHRPASYEETVAALKNAYRAMRHKSGS